MSDRDPTERDFLEGLRREDRECPRNHDEPLYRRITDGFLEMPVDYCPACGEWVCTDGTPAPVEPPVLSRANHVSEIRRADGLERYPNIGAERMHWKHFALTPFWSPSHRRLASPMFEREFQRQVTQFAKLNGWRVYSLPDSRLVTLKGYPDLTMWHLSRGLIFVELKAEKGQLRKEQIVVHEELISIGQIVFVWRPQDWNTIESVLGSKTTAKMRRSSIKEK